MNPCNSCEKELLKKLDTIERDTKQLRDYERENNRSIKLMIAHVCTSHMRTTIVAAFMCGLTYSLITTIVKFILH